jgi:DNA-directed RNA polymerase subunit M/transcription elongation factor TFIIS
MWCPPGRTPTTWARERAERQTDRRNLLLVDQVERIGVLLRRHGLNTASRHFQAAEHAFAEKEWESANAQVRSYLEAIFEGVAAIRLGTVLTGGNARKRLEDEGALAEKEAAVVKAVLLLAHERGSHAGLSDPEDAAARRLLGFAVAVIGLSLIPDLITVQEVLATQFTAPEGTRLPTDAEVTTTCPTCNTNQALFEAAASRSGDETVYICKNGCQRIVLVGQPGEQAWDGRGYRLGPHVIRNAADLLLPIVGSPGTVLVPASPAALMEERLDERRG